MRRVHQIAHVNCSSCHDDETCWEQARKENPTLFNELGRLRPDVIVNDRDSVQAYYRRGRELIDQARTPCMLIVAVSGQTVALCRECLLRIAEELT